MELSFEGSVHGHLAPLPFGLWQGSTLWQEYMPEEAADLITVWQKG